MKINILKIVNYFYPAQEPGGPIPVVYNFAKRLIQRGHSVTIWTSNLLTAKDKMSSKTLVSQYDGIPVVYFDSLLRYHWVAITPGLISFCQRELHKFDIIHFRAYRDFMATVVAWFANKKQIPYVIETLGTLPILLKSRYKKLLYDKLIGMRILNNAAKLIAKSYLEEEHYIEAGFDKKKIELIPNGIDFSEYPEKLQRNNFRKKYNIKKYEKLVLYLGRIHPIKGLDILIKAFSKLNDEDIKLAIVGPDDGYLSDLRFLVNKLKLNRKVVFTGPLYDVDKYEAYIDADIFVLPSVQENLPKVILEALLCEVPVIITDTCGIAPWIKNKAGLVVPYNEDSLAYAIRRLLKDEGLRALFKKNSHLILREHFTWEKQVDKLERLYLDIVGGKNVHIRH